MHQSLLKVTDASRSAWGVTCRQISAYVGSGGVVRGWERSTCIRSIHGEGTQPPPCSSDCPNSPPPPPHPVSIAVYLLVSDLGQSAKPYHLPQTSLLPAIDGNCRKFQHPGGKECTVHTFNWPLLSFAAESSANGPHSGKAPYHSLPLPLSLI
jgi:hypothetical protein